MWRTHVIISFQLIRYGSRSIIAKNENLRRLHVLTARIPFDDRINGKASIQDFDLSLIQAFLHEVKSDLFEESKSMSLADVSRNMLIAKGPDEELRPVNVGLLFFTQKPENYFSRCWIEVVVHKDFSGKDFTETYFKGPIHHQLRDVLRFIRTAIIHEVVEKVPNRAEANRYFNFPYVAVEESLSNAVYHKSYEIGNPIEVQIWPDKIEILSYPGPVPPVDAQILQQQKRIVSRDYRNRRIGDFLKELELTEGRGTGFPTIYREMEKNGSPEPVFETDKACTYFLTVLPANISFLEGGQATAQAVDEMANEYISRTVELLDGEMRANEILAKLNLTHYKHFRKTYLNPSIEEGYVEMTIPDKPSSPNQKYRLTPKGKLLKSNLKKED